MNMRRWISLAGIVSIALIGTTGRGDDIKAGTVKSQETKGLIKDTGFGSFVLDEKGTARQFNLSASKSQYEPAVWRPAKGDQVSVVFTPIPKKDGNVVLAVDNVTLVKAGPDTVPDLKSPIVVEIVDTGRSGIKGKVPTGQIVEFSFERGSKRVPEGWVIAVGEKAKVEFKPSTHMFSFNVSLAIVSIEKQAAGK